MEGPVKSLLSVSVSLGFLSGMVYFFLIFGTIVNN